MSLVTSGRTPIQVSFLFRCFVFGLVFGLVVGGRFVDARETCVGPCVVAGARLRIYIYIYIYVCVCGMLGMNWGWGSEG